MIQKKKKLGGFPKARRSVRVDGEWEHPRDSDVFNLWADPDAVVRREKFLTEDVTQADLSKYPQHQLEGRYTYYERQYTFERNEKIREQFHVEMIRTEIELARRRIYTRKEAERVFAL